MWVLSAAARAELLTVPYPELSRLEPVVQQQFEELRTELDKLGHTRSADAAVWGEAGRLYHAYDFFDAAEACYRNAETIAPREARWAYYLGVVEEGRGALREAVAALEQALSRAPEDPAVRLRLGEALLQSGEPHLAEQHFAVLHDWPAFAAAALAGLGRAALAQRQYDAAIRALEAALQREPQGTSLHYPLGMAYRGKGDIARAEQHLRLRGQGSVPYPDPWMDEVRAGTRGARMLWLRGSAAARAGDYRGAAEAFRQMVTANPEDCLARIEWGAMLLRLRDYPAAREQYSAALRCSPGNARAEYDVGVLLLLTGSADDAISHFSAAVQADPDLGAGHFHLANELLRRGRAGEALPHYQAAVRLDPGNSFARLMEAMTLVRLSRYAEARTRLEDAHAVFPENADVAQALARLMAACPEPGVRDGPRALQLARALIENSAQPDFEHARTLAMAFAETAQYREAAELQRAMIAELEAARRPDLAQLLRRDLSLYIQGKACRVPWRGDDPIFAPVPQALAPLDAAMPASLSKAELRTRP